VETRAGDAEWAEPEGYCDRCRRSFFPQSKSVGIDQSEASPAVQHKITSAGTVSRSFAEGSELLQRLADVPVSAKQVERVTRRIGSARVAQRDAEVRAYQALPLVEKFQVPPAVTAPDLAVVMADGGRLQILDRSEPAAALPSQAESGTDAVASGAEAERAAGATANAAAAGNDVVATEAEAEEAWEEEKVSTGHWREDKVGLLLTMHSTVSATDPCPEIPASFREAARIPELVRALSRQVKEPADSGGEASEAQPAAEPLPEPSRYQPPQVQQRQVLASRLCWPSFAPIVAAAAWAWGFQGARRKAFVGDGSANHWRLQGRFFGSFVPILDFLQALSCVYAAATARQSRVAGWLCYRQGMSWVWQGQVTKVIAALQARQAELGLPEQGESQTSPRQVVQRTLTYLGNQQGKMHDDE
jgi:hypothetical protein